MSERIIPRRGDADTEPADFKLRFLKRLLRVQEGKRRTALRKGDGAEALRIEERMTWTEELIHEWANRIE